MQLGLCLPVYTNARASRKYVGVGAGVEWPEVKAAKATGKAYRLNDGDGPYLQVSPTGSKSWLYMFRWRGKLKEMGLGSVDDVKLASAREKATDARLLVRAGTNPLDARRTTKAVEAMPTLKEFALTCIDNWAPGWKTARLKKTGDIRLSNRSNLLLIVQLMPCRGMTY